MYVIFTQNLIPTYVPQNLLNQLEFEKSLLSNAELQHKKDIILAEKIKKGEVEVDMDTASQLTMQDLKDAWQAELDKFHFAPRTTAADKSNDVTSLNRKLENTLVLLTEQKIGKEKLLLLPQGKHQAGETLLQTAERVLHAVCGKNLHVQFWGCAPVGFYKYRYPKAANDFDAVGAKVFFFRAMHKTGNVDKQLTKFEWLDKTAVLERLSIKENYVRSVKPLLL